MNFNILVAVSPILAVAVGGLLLMLAEAFATDAVAGTAGVVSTDVGAVARMSSRSAATVVLFAAH